MTDKYGNELEICDVLENTVCDGVPLGTKWRVMAFGENKKLGQKTALLKSEDKTDEIIFVYECELKYFKKVEAVS